MSKVISKEDSHKKQDEKFLKKLNPRSYHTSNMDLV